MDISGRPTRSRPGSHLPARLRSPIPAALALVLAGAALSSCGGGSSSTDPQRNAKAKTFTLTIARNAIGGGKNDAEAEWVTKTVIPGFTAAEKAKGLRVKVVYHGYGVDDEAYKTKTALDLKSKAGADIVSLDGIWVGEFAQAGYIKPLSEVVGPRADGWDGWDGWSQIPSSVQQLGSFQGKRYGIPPSTDGRVLFYNRKLFAQAGLPATWQPTSWTDVLAAGRALKKLPGVTPLQINAGTAMGEATTTQGVLPLLAGAGAEIYSNGRWTGGGTAMKQVLGVYQQLYGPNGLGDRKLQEEAKGRDKSFEEFAANKIGVLLEGVYLWRAVLNPKDGIARMPDRDQAVGYALIPAMAPGKGVKGQSFVSMSGGAVATVNPHTKYPQQAFDLLAYLNRPDVVKARIAGNPEVTSRNDVNAEALKGDPFLSFVARKVLPITLFRPGLAAYTQVSTALQEATASVVAGHSPDDAAAQYGKKLEGIVGGPAHVNAD